MARTVVNEHGFTILKDSKTTFEATARISPTQKYVFLGRCTFEKKWTERYGNQVIISHWQQKGVYPELVTTQYEIGRGRIELCVPEVVARRMRLIR